MQDGVLAFNGDGQGISRATGKYAEHGSRIVGYKSQSRKKGMATPNNTECLYWPLGAECVNTAKGEMGDVGGVR